MHWYGFQMFTIRSTCSLGVVTWTTSSSSAQSIAQALERGVDLVTAQVALDHRPDARRLSIVREPGGSNFASGGFSA